MNATWERLPGPCIIQLGDHAVRLDRVDVFRLEAAMLMIYMQHRDEPLVVQFESSDKAKQIFKDLMGLYQAWLDGKSG
jgi:hypothetical protein